VTILLSIPTLYQGYTFRVIGAFMHERLEQLLARLHVGDDHVSNDAIVELAMLLEKRSLMNPEDRSYEGVISPELLTLELSEADLETSIDTLVGLLDVESVRPMAIWALGKTSVPSVLVRLLRYLHNRLCRMDEYTVRQALIAVEDLLGHVAERPCTPVIQGALIQYDPRPWLARFTFSTDLDLRVLAKRLSEKVSALLGDPGLDEPYRHSMPISRNKLAWR
jgi:hypothetical protein